MTGIGMYEIELLLCFSIHFGKICFMRSVEPKEESILYLVTWKKQARHIELFYDLEIFVKSYPRYNLPEVGNMLASGIGVFEDEELRIEQKAVTRSVKPDFPPMFFWEMKYDKINWRGCSTTVIQRVLDRGMPEHWQELKRFYGRKTIIAALKDNITYLPESCMEEVSAYFNIPKVEMLCFKRMQSMPKLWFLSEDH